MSFLSNLGSHRRPVTLAGSRDAQCTSQLWPETRYRPIWLHPLTFPGTNTFQRYKGNEKIPRRIHSKASKPINFQCGRPLGHHKDRRKQRDFSQKKLSPESFTYVQTDQTLAMIQPENSEKPGHNDFPLSHSTQPYIDSSAVPDMPRSTFVPSTLLRQSINSKSSTTAPKP